jgi:hypothetical protein
MLVFPREGLDYGFTNGEFHISNASTAHAISVSLKSSGDLTVWQILISSAKIRYQNGNCILDCRPTSLENKFRPCNLPINVVYILNVILGSYFMDNTCHT